MAFCGQCGLQLAPGSTACPRCGSVTEPNLSPSVEEPHLYDSTIVTSFGEPNTPRPPVHEPPLPPVLPTPPQQQLLFLRPDGTVPSYGNASSYDPTSTVSSPNRQSYPPQSNNAYPSQPDAYPSFTPQSDAGHLPLQGQYGGMGSMPPLSPQILPRRRGNGRVVGLIAILIALLLLLGPTIVVTTQPGLLKRIIGNPTPTPVITQIATPIVTPTATPIVTPTVLSSSDYARATIQEYYRDINARNYQAAYNLWGSNFQNTNSYNSFAAGYANTRHDDLTINSTTPLSDGTISMDITLNATENTASGTVYSTYQGTYIIGLENGAWKFLSGNFRKVA